MSYQVPSKFPTTVIGSYPKLPEASELIKRRDRGEISEEEFHRLIRGPIAEVVKDYLEAGIDIVSDGEQSREDMVVYFAQRVQGYEEGEWVRIYDNMYFRKPIIKGPLIRTSPLAIEDWLYTSSISGGRPVKFIITGPYTMMEWSFNVYYKDRSELIMALAKVIREEVLDAVRAGAKYIQVDEPALSTRPWREEAELAGEALRYVFSGIEAKRVVHICYGRLERILPYILDYPVDQFALEFKNSNFRLLPYLKEYGYNKELGYGVVDVHSMQVETVKEVKEAIEKLMKLDVLPPEKVYINPDCGLKPLPREVAKAKLVNMVKAASEARSEW
ncbi:Probable methylcobalamin:homocysteine methyltransferase [Acidilobus saccharovorans 345-15]|uniref:Methionine synthase n=1 Tax=Acidilobus saccharovorans (strain DSM 16705 / JCM 18335 / VKM B-2471 / 345-15) TaxID=666510 RepID=D9Q092_ACIS3|nr:methionine synthase [Acidilobus saccharovorans]ADL18730.1 Probable methylcobalamin:homocysteine methyltransferase [Acidilobus saccharovorans 345-15]